jgi:hypothetical protein
MRAILTALLLGRLSSALGYLVKMPADLLFSAAQFSKSLLDLFDGRRGLYGLEGVVVLFHVGFALGGRSCSSLK